MTTPPRARRSARALVALTALSMLSVLSLSACSDGSDDAPAADPSASTSYGEPDDAPTLEVEPVVRSGVIVGRLPRQDRTRVEQAVAEVAVRYLQAAYLGGDYPRQDFRDAYPGFTGGAARVARRDKELLTNRDLGPRIDDVTPLKVEVKVDLLAVDRRAVAATDHVELVFRTGGDVTRRVRVAGELRLAKDDGRWKIFAYDLTKGAR